MPEPEPKDPSPATPAGAAPGPLGRKTTSGFAWLGAQTLGSKVVSMGAQIALARILVPDDFGLFALALTVVRFAQMLHGFGLREVLIRLHDEFDKWASPAFWMTIVGGVVSGLAVFAAAGPAALAYAEPELAPILRFVAIAMPLTALAIVPTAALEIHFRYRALAVTQLLVTVAQFSSSIVLAMLGLGVWALVIPLVAARGLTLLVILALARSPIRRSPDLDRWKPILRDVGMLTLAGFLTTATLQGDYIVLGLFVTSAQVGLYYIAFQLSRQALNMLASNFARVLLPAFSQLKDDTARQRSAFLEAASLLTLVFVPICLIAAALAEPLILVALGDEYRGAVPLFAILSIGSAFRSGADSATPLLRAQGRYATILRLRYVLTPLFFVLLTGGIVLGGVVGGAVGVAVYSAIAGIVQPVVALHPLNGGIRDVVSMILAPLLISFAAGAAAFAIGEFLPQTTVGRGLHLALGATLGAAVYLLLARVLMRDRWDAAERRARPLLARLRGLAPRARHA